MERYYQRIFSLLDGYTIMGLFDGKRDVEDIVTLQTGPKGRVFFFDQEPMHCSQDTRLWDHIFQEPAIFVNSEINSEDKAWVAERYPNFVDWYYFANALVAREWFADYRYARAGWTAPLGKKFLADHGKLIGHRQYRLKLFQQLADYHTSGQTVYAFGGGVDWLASLNEWDHYGVLDESIDSLPTVDVSYDNFGHDPRDETRIPANTISMAHYSNVDFVLVMETVFSDRKWHFSEKIFKPIVAGKPFVLAGTAGSLAYLHQYGFNSFKGSWGESYDSVDESRQRLGAVVDTVRSIYSTDEEASLVNLERAHWRAEANRNWFWSGDFERIIWEELERNLLRAQAELASKQV